MTENWELALKTYKYPVQLSDYERSSSYPGYFIFSPIDNASTTALFEDHFRKGANDEIELWLEVIYWKMYSQGGRSNIKTNEIADHFKQSRITAQQLMIVCNNYLADDTRENLSSIIKLLGFASSAIAIAATFPAFLRPDLFPMVDTRIAKWVGKCMDEHNNASSKAPKLVRPKYLDNTSTVLTLTDIEFVKSWTQWCRHKAIQLSKRTSIDWRARDVEMAVFNAWGDRNKKHPKLKLEVLD
jgi:hypothetical protein